MSALFVFTSAGALALNRWLIGLGLIWACTAIGYGVRLRLLLAHEARQQRLVQERVFRAELEQVLRSER